MIENSSRVWHRSKFKLDAKYEHVSQPVPVTAFVSGSSRVPVRDIPWNLMQTMISRICYSHSYYVSSTSSAGPADKIFIYLEKLHIIIFMQLSHINHQPNLFWIITYWENTFVMKNKTPHITRFMCSWKNPQLFIWKGLHILKTNWVTFLFLREISVYIIQN